METPYGHFLPDGNFVITNPDTPRNWYNYFYTDFYITFTSQAGIGQGFLQDNLGRRLTAVTARGLYLLEGERFWNLAGLPFYDKADFYECVHRPGSTAITLERNGIRSEYTLFVPCEEDKFTGTEVSAVRLTNLGDKPRTLKLISYTDNDFDESYRYQAYNTDTLKKDDLLNGLHFTFKQAFYGDEKIPMCFYSLCSEPLSGWDCARNAFIGTYGSVQDPIALHRGGCSNSACTAEKIGYALQCTVTLAPGESRFVCFSAGLAKDPEAAARIEKRFSTEEKVLAELANVNEKYSRRLGGGPVFESPDDKLNMLLNKWLKYQTDLGSRWARVRHNGYRDIASDTECLAPVNPLLAWQRIKRLLTYQYSNGYAPRTFKEGKIQDNNFSDCAVWLTFTAATIVKELGKPELLYEEVPFNDGTSASVYEHLRRSVEFLHGFTGLHGLIQLWGGDWNDCMNTAGLGHKGVSVWLSIAWVRAARQLRELANQLGKAEDVALLDRWIPEMCNLINKYGWDSEGGYYIYAYSDDDRKIGAASCDEGRVFLNPQLWAILAGGLGAGHEEEALRNACRILDDPLGTRVSTPPYTAKNEWIGTIAGKAPGVQENGGVYLHAMCWKLAVDAMRGDSESVERDITCILPFRNPVVDGRAEPYIVCNCYMGKETGYRYGTPGQSWRTASGQWFLKSMTNFVFGMVPEFEGLALRPCLPASWNTARVTRSFRGFTYEIEYRRTGEKSIFFDGAPLSGDILPLKNGKVLVTF